MKKVLSWLLVVIIACSVVGCNSQLNSSEKNSTEYSELETEKETTISTMAPATEKITEPSTKKPTENQEKNELQGNSEDDSLLLYEVTESTAKEQGGYYLKRNDKFYMLDNIAIPLPSNYNGAFGLKDKGLNEKEYLQLFLESGRGGIISCGDVPILKLNKDDLIIYYSKGDVARLDIRGLDYVGYTIFMVYTGYNYTYTLYDLSSGNKISYSSFDAPELYDSDNMVVEDENKLNYNQKYKITWYEGTEYHEKILPANSRFFKENSYSEIIEGKLTKNGYAEYDISNIPSGIYYLYNRGIVEIE